MIPLAEALSLARERDLDLVEVASNAVPPVCRLLDYGKYMYDQAKKEKNTKHQHHGELREVRFKVKIGDNDMNLKVRRAEQFLKNGDKVKLSVMFRGREIIHPEIGRGLLEKVREQLLEIGQVEKPPTMEGRFMNMIMGPPTAKARPAPAPKPAPKPAATASPNAETKVASEG